MHSLTLVELKTATEYPKLRSALAKVGFQPVAKRKTAGIFVFIGEVEDQRPHEVVDGLAWLIWLHGVRVRRVSAFESASRDCSSLPGSKEVAAAFGL